MATVKYTVRVAGGLMLAINALASAAWVAGRIIAPELGLEVPSWEAWLWFLVLPTIVLAAGLWLSLLVMGLGFRPREMFRG